MSNLIEHARKELELAGWFKEDGMYGGMIGVAVMDLIEKFSGEGHSGQSASICTKLFGALSQFEPLTPLTGEDGEWMEYANGRFQNKRCSHIFKENGQAYDSTGRIFEYPNGTRVQRHDSRVNITFPHMPLTEIIKIPEEVDGE